MNCFALLPGVSAITFPGYPKRLLILGTIQYWVWKFDSVSELVLSDESISPTINFWFKSRSVFLWYVTMDLVSAVNCRIYVAFDQFSCCGIYVEEVSWFQRHGVKGLVNEVIRYSGKQSDHHPCQLVNRPPVGTKFIKNFIWSISLNDHSPFSVDLFIKSL